MLPPNVWSASNPVCPVYVPHTTECPSAPDVPQDVTAHHLNTLSAMTHEVEATKLEQHWRRREQELQGQLEREAGWVQAKEHEVTGMGGAVDSCEIHMQHAFCLLCNTHDPCTIVPCTTHHEP